MNVPDLRAAVSVNGGTPTRYDIVGALRELVTAYGGTPTKYSIRETLREAVTAAGGTPTQWSQVGLLRELVTALGVDPGEYAGRTLSEILAETPKDDGPAPVQPATPEFSQNFAVYATNTLLADGSDAKITQPFTVTSISDNLATLYWKRPRVGADGTVTSGTTTPTAAASGDAAGYTNGLGSQLSSRDLGTTNMFFDVDMTDATNFDADIVIAATAANDALGLHVNRFGAQLYEHSGGATTTKGSSAPLTTARQAWGRAPKNGDIHRAHAHASKGYFYRNGVSMIPAGGAHTRTGTKFGYGSFRDGIRRTKVWTAGVSAGVLRISNDGAYSNTTNWRLYARKKDISGIYPKGYRDITFTGTYDGFSGALTFQWALFDPATDEQLTAWASPQSQSATGGNWSITPRVPAGLETTLAGGDRRTNYPYSLTLADGRTLGAGQLPYSIGIKAILDGKDSSIWIRSRAMFAVAANFVLCGQSNDSNQGQNTNAAVNVPDHPGIGQYLSVFNSGLPVAPTYAAQTTGWDISTTELNGGSEKHSGWYQLVADALGLPVMISIGAVGATGAEIHDPDRGDYAGNYLKDALTSPGHFEAILFSQGENEINSTSTTAALAWRNQWQNTNIPHIKAYANQPAGVDIPVFVMLTGKYIGSVMINAEPTTATIVRREQEALINTAGYYPLSHPVGIALVDAVHFTANNDGYPAYVRRAALSVIKTLTGTGYDGRGPLFTTASRSGDTITLLLTLNGADTLTTSTGTLTGLTGWQVNSSNDFNGTAYTVSAAVLDTGTNTVTLTLGSTPPGPVYVRNYSGVNNDDSNWVIGNYANALIGTIHSKPIVTAILTSS